MLCMGEIPPTHSLQILSTIISRMCLCALVKVKYHYGNEKLLSAWGRGMVGCMSACAVIQDVLSPALHCCVATKMVVSSSFEFSLAGWWPFWLCKMNGCVSVKKAQSQVLHK